VGRRPISKKGREAYTEVYDVRLSRPRLISGGARWSPRVASPVTSAGCLTRTARLFAREHRRIRLAITGQKCTNIIRKIYKHSFARWQRRGRLPACLGAGRGNEATRSRPFGRHSVRAGGRKRGRAACDKIRWGPPAFQLNGGLAILARGSVGLALQRSMIARKSEHIPVWCECARSRH
jgi:hypothetical protein